MRNGTGGRWWWGRWQRPDVATVRARRDGLVAGGGPLVGLYVQGDECGLVRSSVHKHHYAWP
jgi:hypothetical protein